MTETTTRGPIIGLVMELDTILLCHLTVSFVAAMTIMVGAWSATRLLRPGKQGGEGEGDASVDPSVAAAAKRRRKMRKKKKKGKGNLPNPQVESENPNSPPPRSLLHLGVIMDGNRRFGRSKYADAGGNEESLANTSIPTGYLRGHYDGGMKLVDFISWCIKLRKLSPSPCLSHLTVYAFSSENYSRPPSELKALHNVFMSFCGTLISKANDWCLRVQLFSSDGLKKMPKEVAEAFVELVEATKNNTGMVLNVCVGYGGRDEILNGVKGVVEDFKSKVVDFEDVLKMDDEGFGEYLSGGSKTPLALKHLNLPPAAKPPPLDVVLRTSGEQRISNFLIWQCAYSEFFFLEKTWPEVEEKDLRRVKDDFERRVRRFGK